MGNLSASDLKWLVREAPGDMIQKLNSPLVDYLNLDQAFSYTCKPTDPLEVVLARFNETKVHRLWVVDQARRPIGVITLTDMLVELTCSCDDQTGGKTYGSEK